jgi:hypothetical protein
MKYFWGLLLGLTALFGGLFLYQNSSRTPSVDTHGYQLSLDLFVIGIGSKTVSLAMVMGVSVLLGILLGLVLPLAWKSFTVR